MASIKEMLASSQGAPSFFTADTPIGASVVGQITATAIRQATDFKTKEPLVWNDGNPREQIVLTLATGLRDPSIPDDDGTRSLYIKWWGAQRNAFVAAIKEAGDDDVRVGGKFMATYLRDEPAAERGLSATKIYVYRYQQPSATAGLMQQAVQPQAPAQPAWAPPAAAADPWAPSSPAQDPWATQRNGNGNGHAPQQPQQPDLWSQQAPQQQPGPAADPWTAAPTADPWTIGQQPQWPVLPQQPQAPAPTQPPAPAQAPAAAPAADPTAVLGQVKQLILMGLTDAQIAQALSVDHTAIAAVRNLPV